MDKRGWGEGSHVPAGQNTWRLRYRVNGKRHSKPFRGSKSEAKKELRRLLKAGDDGEHVDPHRKTVRQWIEHWLSAGAPGKRREKPSARTVERYSQLLRTHVLPVLGNYRLQKLTPTQIDNLYTDLATKIAPRTCHHVHVVLGSALGAAVRTRNLVVNPMAQLLNVPSPGESDHGIALDEEQLGKLVNGFRRSPLFEIVAIAAYTGMRRNEILGLRWSDFDAAGKKLRVERAIEQTKTGIGFKPPKTKRGYRTVEIADQLVGILRAAHEKMLRLIAGVPDGVAVDLSLVKLPADALMFPSPIGSEIDLAQPRDPHAVTRTFCHRAGRLGFKGLRFHDLRGSHATQLLRQKMPIDVVARRLGHDPAVMMRSYAKALSSDDEATRKALSAITRLPKA
jgi:integrase